MGLGPKWSILSYLAAPQRPIVSGGGWCRGCAATHKDFEIDLRYVDVDLITKDGVTTTTAAKSVTKRT